MRFKSKKISASLATGALAVVMIAAGGSSASATTWCDAAFYNPSNYTLLYSISCPAGHQIRAITKYYASDNTTRVSSVYGSYRSSGSSIAFLPAGTLLAGHYYQEK